MKKKILKIVLTIIIVLISFLQCNIALANTANTTNNSGESENFATLISNEINDYKGKSLYWFLFGSAHSFIIDILRFIVLLIISVPVTILVNRYIRKHL